jgi:uncharacterized cupin superfamily protein
VGPRTGADTGDPQISQVEAFTGDGIRFGIWESTPGGWEIVDRPGTESMLLLTGRIRLTPQDSEPVELVAGDTFVLRKGWTGRWETLETVRKVYTVTI